MRDLKGGPEGCQNKKDASRSGQYTNKENHYKGSKDPKERKKKILNKIEETFDCYWL